MKLEFMLIGPGLVVLAAALCYCGHGAAADSAALNMELTDWLHSHGGEVRTWVDHVIPDIDQGVCNLV